MINLPDVTLVAVDSVACALTRFALEDALSVVAPAATLVFSDEDIRPRGTVSNWVVTPALRSLDAVADVLWREVPRHVATSHFLLVQWDGWPIDGDAWTDDFMGYDYVGAPWPWYDRRAVGNGGFSLRSVELMRAAASLCPPLPKGRPEDEVLCRDYRPRLEHLGFKWPSFDLAYKFSVEHGGDGRPFGFHDIRNWPRFLAWENVAARLLLANDYVRAKIGFRDVENWLRCTTPAG